MKMKVQKAYFKKVLFLVLLLSGSVNFSLLPATAAVMDVRQELSITSELTEQLQDLREGSLPSILSLNLYRLNSASAVFQYQYLSGEEARKSVNYIRSCRTIDPALDATEIIYPFHFFL